jgi:hypothetical protein
MVVLFYHILLETLLQNREPGTDFRRRNRERRQEPQDAALGAVDEQSAFAASVHERIARDREFGADHESGAADFADQTREPGLQSFETFAQLFALGPDRFQKNGADRLGGGLPIGATLASDSVAALFGKGDHASTFGGNPVVCSAARAVLKTISPVFLKSVRSKGEQLRKGLETLKSRFPGLIREVRGAGLMVGAELSVPGDPFVDACRERGLLINCTQGSVLRFLPPLTISPSEIRSGLAILEKCFKENVVK